jgi:phospholipase/carboxylesterase
VNYTSILPKKTIAGQLPPTLVIMHGYGADEFDLLPMASHLDPSFLTISLQAPMALDWGGYSWYDLFQTTDGLRGDHETRLKSEDLVLKALPEIIKKENGNPECIYLMGFSQGAAMCFSLIGRYDLAKIGLRTKAVIILSGYVPDDVRDPLLEKNLSQVPFFLSHGTYDELIDPRAMHNAVSILEHTGAKTFSKEYKTGHGLTEETVSDLRNWMNNLLHS